MATDPQPVNAPKVMVDFIDGEYIERPDSSEQLDLFTTLREGLCVYGIPNVHCSKPATHVAVGLTESGPHAGHVARLDCCLEHANYYARGWLRPHLLYPGVRGAVWIEPMHEAAA